MRLVSIGSVALCLLSLLVVEMMDKIHPLARQRLVCDVIHSDMQRLAYALCLNADCSENKRGRQPAMFLNRWRPHFGQ